MLSPQQLDQAKAFTRWATDLGAFCRDVLGYRDMIAPHDELCRFLQSPGNKLILMPRYSYKSSICTIGYSLWKLSQQENFRILIYSDTNEKAEGFLNDIKNHILGQKATSRFRTEYGPWEVDPKRGVWNQSQVIVAVRDNAQVEPSIDTAGIETSKVGMHYDLIIFDDVVSDKNITTKEQMDKVAECYRKALSLLTPGGQILIVGTRWHFGDLYGRLLAQTPKTFDVLIRQAEEDGTYPFERIGLTPQFLAQQRTQQGTALFSCIYQNEPVDDATATFKAKDFAFYTERPAGLSITCTVDPAISQRLEADDSAIVVVGTDKELNLYLLDAVAGKLLPDQLVETVFSLYRRWAFHTLGLETNAFQKMLKTEIERRIDQERKTNPNFRLFHIEEFTGTSQMSKELRIHGLQPYHERGAIRFPGEKLELLGGVWSQLAFQMLQFPHAPHDDLVDALAYHLPIIRAGGDSVAPPQDPPYSSAAWYEREIWYKQQVKEIARTPRWRRPPMPKLAFS